MPATKRSANWLPLDVRFPRHRKTVRLSRDLRYRHIEAMCHCIEHDTKGHITPGEVDELMRDLTPRRRQQAVQELVDAGLWDLNGNGYVIHDWEDWNEQFDKRRSGAAVRQQRKRDRDREEA